LVRLLKVW